jgi:hypothetical protein
VIKSLVCILKRIKNLFELKIIIYYGAKMSGDSSREARQQQYEKELRSFAKVFKEEKKKHQEWYNSRRRALTLLGSNRVVEHPQREQVTYWSIEDVLKQNAEISLPPIRSFKKEDKKVCIVDTAVRFEKLMGYILEEKELVLDLEFSRRYEGKYIAIIIIIFRMSKKIYIRRYLLLSMLLSFLKSPALYVFLYR